MILTIKQFINPLLRIITLTYLLLLNLFAYADMPQAVADALKKSGISEENVSVYVQALDSEKALFSHHSNKSMNPASVMKLVTTYAALDLLTPAYRWKTEVYRDGEVANGVLEGDLIIKGYGDPSFKVDDFWHLLMRLQQGGIKKINGDLIIDKSYFAKSVGERRTFDDETWRAYNAEPTAFLVNGRNTSFRFEVVNGKVAVDQEFELPEVTIINKMKVSQGGCGSWRNYFNYDVAPSANGAVVTFSGKLAESCGTRYLELSVMDDAQYAYYTFKKLWQLLGGTFNGHLQLKDTPLNAIKILQHDSQPLGYVIYDLNKWSINIMARQLLLTIAAEQHQKPATEALGELTIKTWLASKGFYFKELVVENGSGLSRIERISAKHLGQLLISAYNSPVMSELMASMPILGLDGTVKKRFNNQSEAGRAHLKTGSLNGVSAIAGYLINPQGKRYVLVMMVNHDKAWGSKNAQNILIEEIFKSN